MSECKTSPSLTLRQAPPPAASLVAILAATVLLQTASSFAEPQSPAPKAAADRQQCFLERDVNGFNAPDDKTLYVRVGLKDVFRLDLMGECGDLTFRQSLGFEQRPASPWICSPLDATVVYRETGITQRCPVTAIHKLTAEELAAVPKKDLP